MSEPPQRSGRPLKEPPAYTKYRARPRLLDRGGDALGRLRRDGGRPPLGEPGRRRKPLTWRRALKWLVVGVTTWIALSLVAFLISAQIQRTKVDDAARSALAGGGTPPFTPTTVLFLGSDQRTAGTSTVAETGSLLRLGGVGLSYRRDKSADLVGVLDAFRLLDAAADVDRVRAHALHRVSRVVYAQATT